MLLVGMYETTQQKCTPSNKGAADCHHIALMSNTLCASISLHLFVLNSGPVGSASFHFTP